MATVYDAAGPRTPGQTNHPKLQSALNHFREQGVTVGARLKSARDSGRIPDTAQHPLTRQALPVGETARSAKSANGARTASVGHPR